MSHISTFVSRRFEELHALLNASGYLLDFSGRERSRWEDDPPLGLIHMRAVLLPDADDAEDAEPDGRISFTLVERWSEHHTMDAQEREGLYLCSYSYHGQAGDARLRHEFDPDGHPEHPYHLHPAGADDCIRQPTRPTSPETALSELAVLIVHQRTAGRL
ncbi:MAG TPA: hypothetical protein VID70_09040 [Solirubrobacteraceae bacterium]|jgi:hypothetical protein